MSVAMVHLHETFQMSRIDLCNHIAKLEKGDYSSSSPMRFRVQWFGEARDGERELYTRVLATLKICELVIGVCKQMSAFIVAESWGWSSKTLDHRHSYSNHIAGLEKGDGLSWPTGSETSNPRTTRRDNKSKLSKTNERMVWCSRIMGYTSTICVLEVQHLQR